jgi:hypothetical protein
MMEDVHLLSICTAYTCRGVLQKGGSTLFLDWKPPDGQLYSYMVQKIHHALQNQSHMRLRGMLWVQVMNTIGAMT